MPLTLNSPGRLLAMLVLVLALFGAAYALGSASASGGTQSALGPVPFKAAASSATVVNPPLASLTLPALRHPKPKPKPKPIATSAAPAASPSSSGVATSSAPVTAAPVTPVAPVTPPASSGGGGSGGGGGGGVIISH